MRGRLLLLALAVSVLLNVATIGGFAYQRWVAHPRVADHWAVQTLDLRPDQLPALRTLRRQLAQETLDAWESAMPGMLDLARMLATAQPGDPRIRVRLKGFEQQRVTVQEHLIDAFLAWRATLDPDQRDRLNSHLGEPGYVRRLLGLTPVARLQAQSLQGEQP